MIFAVININPASVLFSTGSYKMVRFRPEDFRPKRIFKWITTARIPHMIIHLETGPDEEDRGNYRVIDREGEYVIYVDLPGAKKESIRIYSDGKNLRVTAETHDDIPDKREYKIKISLDEEIDVDSTKAKYLDGVLVITAPKKTGYYEIKVE